MTDLENPHGSWVQTERSAHEAWARLINEHPSAASLMHVLVSKMGRQNKLIISQGQLADLMGKSRDTVKRAVAALRSHNWIDTYQVGDRGTVNCYIINDAVAWFGPRDGKRHSLFTAAVYLAEDEQPESISDRARLRRVPSLYAGERQLPSGDGLPPPSEPTLPGMEPDLPALHTEQILEIKGISEK